MKKNIFLLLLILLSLTGRAQDLPDSLLVNIDHIDDIKLISGNTYVFIDSVLNLPVNDIPAQHFVPLSSLPWKYVPARLVTKNFYLSFQVHNTSGKDTSFYYFPGTLYSELELYKKSGTGSLEKIGITLNSSGLLHITLRNDEKTTLLVKGTFSRNTQNAIKSRIAAPGFFPYYKMEVDKTLVTKKVVGILFSGALFMMILFTLVNYFLHRKLEFLYNCLYCICMFFLIFFSSYLSKDAGKFKIFFIGYFDLFLLMAGTISYLAFTRKFLNTKVIHTKLDKFLLGEQWVIFILLCGFTWVHFGTDNFVLENRMENIMKLIVILAAIVFVVIALIKRNILMSYLAIGVAVQVFFYAVSLFLIHKNASTDYVLFSPIFYFETGVVVSVFFFLLGLTYKNKREIIGKIKEQEAMKLEVEKKGFETKLAVINAQQEERNRISADMHDDLGAGMTAIRLYSELAKSKLGDNTIPEVDKISSSANELLTKMNAIIWSMSSSNDTLGNMVAYIRIYALEYLEESAIESNIVVPANIPEIEVPGEIRRNVFLVVKEALHNIVKHANATKVDMILTRHDHAFSLIIKDNGKGIDLKNIRSFGNGMKNMKKRMDAVGIQLEIETDNGTVVKLYREIPELIPPEKGYKQA